MMKTVLIVYCQYYYHFQAARDRVLLSLSRVCNGKMSVKSQTLLKPMHDIFSQKLIKSLELYSHQQQMFQQIPHL